MVGRILVESFRSAANTETKLPIEEYMTCVHKISDDPEIPIRLDLMDQLPYAAMIVKEAPHLFGDVLHNGILSIIKKYLLDVDSQVRQSAQEALLVLIKHGMLETKIIETEICPIVEELSRMTVEYLNSGISVSFHRIQYFNNKPPIFIIIIIIIIINIRVSFYIIEFH